MSDKVINDMVAHAKSVAEKRGRNAEWVEKAIRESVAVTETEALEKNIIDVVANDIDDLIKQINGRTIADKGVLKLDESKKKVLEERVHLTASLRYDKSENFTGHFSPRVFALYSLKEKHHFRS